MNDESSFYKRRPPLPPNSHLLHSIRRKSTLQTAPLRNYSSGIRISTFDEHFSDKVEDAANNRKYTVNHHINPFFLAFILDSVIPLLLIISSISCTSVMGMIFILILCIHILICNNLKKSFSMLKICLLINLLCHIVVFVFSIFVFASPHNKVLQSKTIKILGLNFDNEIISTPILPFVSSIIAIICQIISLLLTPFTSFTEFVALRGKVFKSTSFLFIIDFLWEICNIFNASSNLSFFTLPLILYLSLSVISISLTGINGMPIIVIKIIMSYSILYSLFEAYMLSYLGDLFDFKAMIRYNYIAPKNSKAANYVFAVLFSYASVQNLSAPGHSLSVSKKLPTIFIIFSNIFLLVEFFLCFLFSLFYPNYLSILWMIISICASFVGMKTVKKFFFPLLVITFTFTFVPIILTTFGIFRRPIDDGMDYYIEFLELFGLFRYINDFTFSICGFFMMCFFGILGRISLAKVRKKKNRQKSKFVRKNNENNESSRSLHKLSPELLPNVELTDSEENENVSISIENKETRLHLILTALNWFFKYIFVFVIFIVGVTGSYFKNRFAFIVFGCILLCIILLSCYTRPAFIFIKILTCLFFVVTSYFKITINQNCREDIDECLAYGHFGSYSRMLNTGLVAPPNMTLPHFLWPLIIVFIFCTLLMMFDNFLYYEYKDENKENMFNIDEDKGCFNKKKKKKKGPLFPRAVPGRFYNYAHFLIGVFHLVHLFAYTTNIFSILFLLVGISVLTCLYFNKKSLMAAGCCFSSICVSVYLIIYYLSHFNDTRNLITSIIPKSVMNISEIQTPKFEIVLLTAILILTTMFTQASSDDHFEIIQDLFYEIRSIFYFFEFYLCWLCIFIFSIVNDNPSFIKFVLMVFFGFGQISIPNFRKCRYVFLIFNILYLCVQLGCDIFDVDNPSRHYYAVLKYIGFFFSRDGKPSKRQRNLSMLWQLACIFVGIISSMKYEKRERKEKFEKLLSTKIYRAVVAFLHYFLPVIVLGSLCISTCYNRSIFGWFTFIIMVFLTYKREILYKRSGLITLLFNLLFVIYYLLYLGFPSEIFHRSINVFKHVKNKNLTRDWLRYLGIYDIEVSSLIANCISAYAFSVFLNFHNIKVDYERYFNNLPYFLRSLIELFVSYIYELIMIVLSIIATNIHTLDGLFYFIITAVLLLLSFLFHYNKFRALLILAHATFIIIAYHLLSRMPIFTEIGIGHYIKELFNLPFQSVAKYRNFWTAIYCCERCCLHILHSDLYKRCFNAKLRRSAYRYIRSRKLKIINQLDQHILKNKDELINQRIKNVNNDNFDDVMHDLSSSFELLTKDGLEHASAAYFKQLESQESQNKRTEPPRNNNNNDDDDEVNESQDEEEEEEGEKKNKKKSTKKKFVNFLDILCRWFANQFIVVSAMTFNPNCEAGLNVYTLQSIIEVMKRELESYDRNKKSQISPTDSKFIKQLPPSFLFQYQSLADAIDFKIYTANEVYPLFSRYFFMFIRRISFFCLLLMIIVYIFSKPYILGFVILISFIFFFCSYYVPNTPYRFRVFMIIVIFILTLQCICKLDILAPKIIEDSRKINVERMKISPFKLFGIDSESSFIPEILLYIFTVFYIIDQRAWCELFTPNYYYTKFKKEIEDFPQNFSSGNQHESNIVKNLGMEIGRQHTTRVLKRNLESRGLIEGNHSLIMNIIDAITLLLLILFWTTWSKDKAGSLIESATMNYAFQIDVLFIFILIIHVVFMLFFDYCHIAKVLYPMIFVNLIWLSYTYCMSFFYIPVANRNYNKPSLYIFVFLRILASIVACHRIQKGKVVVEYQLLSFEKNWKSIIIKNNFILMCPFIFEVQSILMWMSRKTYVGLIDFMMILDFGMNLEILISQHFDPKSKGHPEKQKVFLVGGFIIFLFLVLLFGPLFFMTSGSGATSTNKPVSVTLKIGMTPFKPFYESTASISTVTKQQMQEIANNKSPYTNVIILNSNEDSSILRFQNNPPNYWFPNENEIENVVDIIEKSVDYVDICPYYLLEFTFESPTTNSNSQFISKYFKDDCITSKEDRKHLSQIIQREDTGTILSFKNMPLLYLIPTSDLMMDADEYTRMVNLTLRTFDSDHFELEPLNESEHVKMSFLLSDYLSVLIYSQPVSSDNLIGSLIQEKGGITGIYILIIVTFGVVIRNMATSQLDDLWMDKMEKPQKLYRIIVAINTFRAANDCENELITTETLLLLLRSKETCMKLTEDRNRDEIRRF